MGNRTTGLIVGKFMPPHAGHVYLIHRAAEQVDALEILLLGSRKDPIPPVLRRDWLEQLAPDNARVKLLQDRHPTDYSDPDVWDKWRRLIRSVLKRGPDLVFSSEDYGNQLAELLRAQHVMVDPARREVPVSGSQIRNDPMTHWVYLPEIVRPWFVRRVVVLAGSQRTGRQWGGKLARRTETVWAKAPELPQTPLGPEEAACLADRQVQAEDRASRKANRLLIVAGGLVSIRVQSVLRGRRIPALAPGALARRYRLVLAGDLDRSPPAGRSFLRSLKRRLGCDRWIELPRQAKQPPDRAVNALLRLADPSA
jgi:NadR type nicotinamide-nucleotide adenylyltransferase